MINLGISYDQQLSDLGHQFYEDLARDDPSLLYFGLSEELNEEALKKRAELRIRCEPSWASGKYGTHMQLRQARCLRFWKFSGGRYGYRKNDVSYLHKYPSLYLIPDQYLGIEELWSYAKCTKKNAILEAPFCNTNCLLFVLRESRVQTFGPMRRYRML
ncbi:hypothetical protein BJV82DRAFT_579683 [Fennellomyces sp. T-0311]|nr:hypothetical protein BJV82DRAFT_579683 [Fennellomyces sp. T-0311]